MFDRTAQFLCTVPSGPPQSPSVSSVNSRSIGITWQPPPLPDRNGVITGYVINITSLDTGTRTQLTSTTTALTIPNLAPYTSYVCIIAARTAVGLGPFSTVVTVRTLEAGRTLIFHIILQAHPYVYFPFSLLI